MQTRSWGARLRRPVPPSHTRTSRLGRAPRRATRLRQRVCGRRGSCRAPPPLARLRQRPCGTSRPGLRLRRLARLRRRPRARGGRADRLRRPAVNAHADVEAGRSPSPGPPPSHTRTSRPDLSPSLSRPPPPTPMRPSRLGARLRRARRQRPCVRRGWAARLRRLARLRRRTSGRKARAIAFAGWRVADVEAGALAFRRHVRHRTRGRRGWAARLRRAARFRHRPCGRGAGPFAFAGRPPTPSPSAKVLQGRAANLNIWFPSGCVAVGDSGCWPNGRNGGSGRSARDFCTA